MTWWFLALAACSPDDLPDTGDDASDPEPHVALEEVVTGDALRPHLEAFAGFGADNGDTRAWGTAGFDASVAYAAQVLEDAGFTVEVRTDAYVTWTIADAALEQLSPTPTGYELGDDFLVFDPSAGGDVSAAITAVDVLVPPPTADNSSTSGCEAADFDGFPAGNVALLQRGSCTFAQKVANAQAAGASAVVVFNEGQPGRTDVVEGSLDSASPPSIPVVGIGYPLGADLVAAAESGEVVLRVMVEVGEVGEPVTNVIAERPGAEGAGVLWVGAHLDSVPAGPGINDNASGSALVLALAEGVAETGLDPEVGLRLSLWDGEERGLRGSWAHVSARVDGGESLDDVVAYLNFDMIGSPNGGTFLYDGDGSNEGLDFGSADAWPLPDGMAALEGAFRDWFDAEGLMASEVGRDCPTDSLVFLSVDVPVGGIFSGAYHPLTVDQQDAWGGQTGTPHDACYHEACDDLDNLSDPLLDRHARAAAAVVQDIVTGDLTVRQPAARPRPPLPAIALPDGHHAAAIVTPLR